MHVSPTENIAWPPINRSNRPSLERKRHKKGTDRYTKRHRQGSKIAFFFHAVWRRGWGQ